VIIDDGFLDGGDIAFETQGVFTGRLAARFKGGRYVLHSELNAYSNLQNHFENVEIGSSGAYPFVYKPKADFGYSFYVNFYESDTQFRFREFKFVSGSQIDAPLIGYEKQRNLRLGSAVNSGRRARVRLNEFTASTGGFYNGNVMYNGFVNATDYELIYFGNLGNSVFKTDGAALTESYQQFIRTQQFRDNMTKFLYTRKNKIIEVTYNELISDPLQRFKITGYPREAEFAERDLALIGLEMDVMNGTSRLMLQVV
jgi:hypothetical protein